MSKTDYAVFVGRFQPIHRGHIKIIENALKEAGRLIIVVGSERTPLSLKNPWSFEERKNLIELSIPAETRDRISIVPLRDFLYQDTHWTIGLQSVVRNAIDAWQDKDGYAPPDLKVSMIGHFKDDSSYYLKQFPQWGLISEPNHYDLNSRDIRWELFENRKVIPEAVGKGGSQDQREYNDVERMLANFCDSERFEKLKAEHEFLKGYKAQWKDAPHPPTFVTTDAVVVMSGHVLLVRRGKKPGKGCLALPGGFVKPNRSVFDSALEELKEETAIVYPRENLRAHLKKQKVFDHPFRDTRGRTITHGFFFQLPTDELPRVKGGDDASYASWVPLADLALLEDQFYSDHMHIINYFIYDGQ